MSPIEFGDAPFELILPALDINLIGSVALTVWELANQYSIIVVFFFLVLAVSAIGWLYNFVTHRRRAPLADLDWDAESLDDLMDSGDVYFWRRNR